MIRKFITSVAFCGLMASQPGIADEGADLQKILDDHWVNTNKEQVFFRTDPDGYRMNGKLAEFSKKARDRRATFNGKTLEHLGTINTSALSEKDLVTYRLFKYEREIEWESYKQKDHLFPINKLTGYHTYFADAPSNMAFLEVEDYERYLVSLADFPRYNQEHIDLLKEGIKTGYTHYCKSMEGYEKTIVMHLVQDPKDSRLFIPFAQFPPLISEAKQAELTQKGIALIREKVIPEYQKFYDFFTGEYRPNCRKNVGITSLKGGADYYQYLIRYFTTTNMSPREIHELGLQEVKRIRAEMQAIIDMIGYEGDQKAFLRHLRTDGTFYAKSKQSLLEKAAFIAKRIEGELPKYFGKLPRIPYTIRGTDDARGGHYMSPAGDGKTPGTFFLGTGDLSATPLYDLEALLHHEGVPGHHLQLALALEMEDMPEFRKTVYHSAYGEGWGLYAERLGKEMGFYQDPYSDFGRLAYESWRASRLVVDTGMHAFGWSRQRALDFLLENTGLSKSFVTLEVDRYITWPAQALSYKIGELKILGLRKQAEYTLGKNFDLRAFHDMLLSNGSLPIVILEEMVAEWIVDQEKADFSEAKHGTR